MTESRQIPLSRGLFATVDAADFDWLNQWTWCALTRPSGDHTDFAATRVETVDGKQRSILMHRQIMDAPKGMVVDHRDGNQLNNTRANLRVVTQAKNSLNRIGRRKGKTSKYKGVAAHRYGWCVHFRLVYLGFFKSEEDGARAYDLAARAAGADVALLNFPDDGPAEAERRAVPPVVAPPRVQTSKHKGVTWNKNTRKWRVQYKKQVIGAYNTEDDAARVAANYFSGGEK